jgi:hypothetical protein
MRRIFLLGALFVLAGVFAAGAATIQIVNIDGAGEGFNDPTAAAPVGGNPGVTVGQQRLNVFQEAADIWGALLPSAVTIRVRAKFDPQTCTSSSAVLGSAGPVEVYRDFAGAELASTWYHVALANKLAGVDLNGGADDISATFNSNLNGDPGCLGGTGWYYGFDGNEGADIELLPVVLHELGHGLGFSTLVGSGGAELSGFQDLYETFIRDNTQGTTWNNLTQLQRAASAVNTGNVVWDGFYGTVHAPLHLGGTPTMYVNAGALPPTIVIGTANFGPALTEGGVTGDVVLVDDGTGTTTDGCEPLVNAGAVAGNIALIDRGTCAFVTKAQEAQAAGAIAVIIANNLGTGAISLGGSDPTITIPVVSVSLADGNAIKAELPGVNVTLALDPSQLAGADANGRVKLYAPNPYEGGSSISHWDVSALPNLLMEPAISSNLSGSVDLTLAHFTDLGWLDELPTGVEGGAAPAPGIAILSNYPNPFNPTTSIRYQISPAQNVELAVFDVRGRLVRVLESGATPAGVHESDWDGTDRRGRPAASGIYYVRLAGEHDTMTRKIVLLK